MNEKAIDIYIKILNGELNKFPHGFWTSETNGVNNSIICTKYLIENVLKWDSNDIKNKLTTTLLRQYKLAGMLEYYNNSTFLLINNVYPNRFMPWELKCTPMGYWDKKEHRIMALKWLCEKLNVNKSNIKQKLITKNFKKYGLGALLSNKYNDTPYLAINELFPNRYKIWEVSRVPQGYWDNIHNCRNATIWLINKLDLSDEELNEKLTAKDFRENGLKGMLQIAYKGSAYLAIYDLLYEENKRAI